MKMFKVCVLLSLFIMSCSSDKVSFDTVEDARRQVRENVTLVAQTFRAENKLQEYDLYVRGDSTQSAECPQGDGWASVDFKNKEGKLADMKLKCSTVSLSISCMTSEDFKTKSYSSEEGRCNKDIPFPLPKLNK
jgi:hypothetical protein